MNTITEKTIISSAMREAANAKRHREALQKIYKCWLFLRRFGEPSINALAKASGCQWRTVKKCMADLIFEIKRRALAEKALHTPLQAKPPCEPPKRDRIGIFASSAGEVLRSVLRTNKVGSPVAAAPMGELPSEVTAPSMRNFFEIPDEWLLKKLPWEERFA